MSLHVSWAMLVHVYVRVHVLHVRVVCCSLISCGLKAFTCRRHACERACVCAQKKHAVIVLCAASGRVVQHKRTKKPKGWQRNYFTPPLLFSGAAPPQQHATTKKQRKSVIIILLLHLHLLPSASSSSSSSTFSSPSSWKSSRPARTGPQRRRRWCRAHTAPARCASARPATGPRP